MHPDSTERNHRKFNAHNIVKMNIKRTWQNADESCIQLGDEKLQRS